MDPATPSPAPRPERMVGVSPLLECAPLPMVEVTGPLHTMCAVNAAFCRLLNSTRSELIGRAFTALVPDGERCIPLLNRVYQTGKFETLINANHSDLEPADWLYAMWPILDADDRAERVVIQVTTVDSHQTIAEMNEALLISGVRQHELLEEAEKSKAESHAEIARRMVTEASLLDMVDQLRKATRAADQAAKAKDEFIAVLSHELRTPLAPVLLATAFLREDRRLPADVREELGMIERNVTLEARLIDDLLDLTKISHGKLNLRSEACDAHSLIGRAIEIVRGDAREKEITIERVFSAEHSGLRADPARFQQVVWNLLRNAVKFTPRGGKISVRTLDENMTESGRWLRIEVTDTGIGIDQAALDQIFLPFDQGPFTGDHRFGGMGLGLAIAREVVKLHGGHITAESAGTNQGATFIVELPSAILPALGVKESAPPFHVRSQLSGEALPPLRLLLVEDHVTTLKALSGILRRDGHHVIAAASVTEALAEAAANTFDLVVSDLGLPDGTGTEMMEKLRTAYGLRGIALSGYGMEDDLKRSKAAGFVVHLTKPVAIGELRRALRSLSAVATNSP